MKNAICFVALVGTACDVPSKYDSAGLLGLPRIWLFLNSPEKTIFQHTQ